MSTKDVRWVLVSEKPQTLFQLNIPVRVIAGKDRICVVRNEEGYFAVGDRCPHQGASLSNGYLKEGKVVCPFHHFEFDLHTGRHVAPDSCGSVSVFPVKLEDGKLYVGVSKSWW